MNIRENRPQPYVGVSGVVMQKDVQSSGLEVRIPQQIFLEAYAEKAGIFNTDRLLALGVKATHRTQYQDKESEWGRDWYPVGEQEFEEALSCNERKPRTLGVVQAHLDINHIGNSLYREEFMQKILYRGRAWIQAVQFDMLPWHNRGQMLDFLEKVREDSPELRILLQCHGKAMEELGRERSIRRLGAFASCIDYVLFDASHGTGTHMNAEQLDEFLEEAYASSALSNIGFAVAGGLNAERVEQDLPQLLAKFPDLSWDAEGQLHPLNNVGKRPLQMDRTKEYLHASARVLTQH